MKIIALYLHKHYYSWVVIILRPQYTPRPDRGPMGLGQYNSLGEYYDPHTASSVFLILLFLSNYDLIDIKHVHTCLYICWSRPSFSGSLDLVHPTNHFNYTPSGAGKNRNVFIPLAFNIMYVGRYKVFIRNNNK